MSSWRGPNKRAKKSFRDGEDDGNDDDADDDVQRLGCCIYFYADVSKKSVARLLREMNEAWKENVVARGPKPHSEIIVYVHSLGGDAYAGLSAMNHLRHFPCRVVTVADGMVASAATLLLLGGHERRIMPHTHVLIHQLRTGFWGKYDELKDEYRNSTLLMESLMDIYTKETSIPRDELETMLRSERCMSAEECVAYGIGVLC